MITNAHKRIVYTPVLPARARQAAPAALRMTPADWASDQASIVHPTRGRIRFDAYEYQRDFLAGYDAPRRIVLKARQIGFSQVFALEALYAAIHEPESTILLVSRSGDLAVNLLRYCYQTLHNLRSAPALTKENESELALDNGSRIKSLPANRSTGRGFAATRVYLDEFAYADYAQHIYQSIAPALSQGGKLIIGSTPNGVGNLFHELFTAGAGFDRMTVPWHACPAYYTPEERAAGTVPAQAAWYCQERSSYSDRAWAAEYECSFEGSGGAVFRFVRERATALEQPGAIEGHSYAMGCDWGKSADFTVLSMVDMTARQLVALERFNQIDYAVQLGRLQGMYDRFRPVVIMAEENSIGQPIIEQLWRLDLPVQPFHTSNATKARVIEDLLLAFEQNTIAILNDPVLIAELESFSVKKKQL
jgi:hypothetical protein